VLAPTQPPDGRVRPEECRAAVTAPRGVVCTGCLADQCAWRTCGTPLSGFAQPSRGHLCTRCGGLHPSRGGDRGPLCGRLHPGWGFAPGAGVPRPVLAASTPIRGAKPHARCRLSPESSRSTPTRGANPHPGCRRQVANFRASAHAVNRPQPSRRGGGISLGRSGWAHRTAAPHPSPAKPRHSGPNDAASACSRPPCPQCST
jgi:hypothetical protein